LLTVLINVVNSPYFRNRL